MGALRVTIVTGLVKISCRLRRMISSLDCTFTFVFIPHLLGNDHLRFPMRLFLPYLSLIFEMCQVPLSYMYLLKYDASWFPLMVYISLTGH